MISREKFHLIYEKLPFKDLGVESYLYDVLKEVIANLTNKSHNNPKIIYEEQKIFDYMIQEFTYLAPIQDGVALRKIIEETNFTHQFITIVVDKFFFNEIAPYSAVSLVSRSSPIITTMELNINFILNRIGVIKKTYPNQNDIILDMFSKVFLMFKSVNYLLSSGFETEAFSTWRTIHELECVIKVISSNKYIVPTYLRHIVYNNAFRDDFEDKEEQQATIDELKMHMKSHGLKSKDMKKYIEYGWLYSIVDIEEKVPGFKLNFRNGLEAAAELTNYSHDYEMSSEVAHSSPLLIYSNKSFFKSITVVRSYESFLRLEDLFYELLQTYNEIDRVSYENMRNQYLVFIKRILNREIQNLNNVIRKNIERKKILNKK